jgi:hypothetical protein
MITELQTILKAEEGYTLTNGETFGKVVYLGKNDSQDNWHEITDAEAEKRQTVDESTL